MGRESDPFQQIVASSAEQIQLKLGGHNDFRIGILMGKRILSA